MPNLRIYGIEKEPGSLYLYCQTYTTTGANLPNGDDLYRENFATTDVKPGTYALRATNAAGVLYKDLGTYTFLPGRDTFIDLFPVYLPFIRENSAWNSTLFIRNNHSADTARVDTTFIHYTGSVQSTRTDFIAPNGSLIIDAPANFAGSATVISSRDIVVNVKVEACGTTCEPAGYSGVTPETGNGSPGWERAGLVAYVPLIKVDHYGRSSQLHIANVGRSPNTYTVTFYDSQGNEYSGFTHYLDVNGSTYFNPYALLGSGYYSAKLVSTSQEPLAVVVLEGEGNLPFAKPAMYNAFSSGGTQLYAPKVKKNYYGHTSGFGIQNVDSSWASVQAVYHDMNGILVGTASFSIAPFGVYILYNPVSIPDGFLGSVIFTSTNGRRIVGQENESSGSSG